MFRRRSQTLTIGHPSRIHEKTIAQQQPNSCTSRAMLKCKALPGGTMRRNHELGQALVTVALGLVVLLGILGLGIDFGYLRYEKGKMQTAADAAAIAGAAEVLYTDVSTAAQAAATADGFANGTGGVIVTVNHPPLSGPNTGNSNYVEAIVAQPQTATFFMKVLGVNSVPLSARSVALGSSPNCIYALNTTGDAIVISLAIVQVACGVIDDSNLGGLVAALDATSIGLAGTNDGLLVTTNPNAQQHIPKATDPFASLPAPTVGSCVTHPTQTIITTTTVLNPGTYCGGIRLSGGQATFNPGVYILNGGGLSMTSALGGVATGTGVTFYNTGSGAGSCNTCYGGINSFFTFGSSLTAPTTGTYAGILFFQDRNNPQQANFDFDASGGTRTLTGAYYFADATVSFLANFGNSYTIIDAKRISWTVALQLNADFSSLPDGSPIKNTGVLAE
jgi:Flp pilus assembly protein TadG